MRWTVEVRERFRMRGRVREAMTSWGGRVVVGLRFQGDIRLVRLRFDAEVQRVKHGNV